MPKSKVTLELDTIKYTSKDVQISKPAADAVAERLYQEVLEGNNSAFQVVEMINFVDAVGKSLKDKEDENGKNKWVDLVRDEITRDAGGKTYVTSKYGTKFSLAETGTKYDYTVCGDPLWTKYEAQIAELDKKKKEREKFLKTITDVMIVSFPDPDTGEMHENIELTGPIKTSTSSYKTELLKD